MTRGELGKGFHKRVHHYLMARIGGDSADHDHEYDEVRWFPASEALKKLTFADEVEILRRAVALMEEDTEAGHDGG